ncbi:MAG: DUF4091 domain-containing protein [Clostridia bacterium]|nr:DUF4091 domain-containing protein [Clostridia bacterium]
MVTVAKITNEAYRVRLDDRGNPIPELTCLVSARNDTAAFQIIVQSNFQYSVNVGTAEWFSDKNARIYGKHERIRIAVSAPFDVELNPEGWMTDNDDVQKADVLLTQDVVESRANVPVGIWAEIQVPADALPGNHTVKVSVYRSFYGEDEEVVLTREIPLTVSRYVLPDPQNWCMYLNLWQHLSSVARHHDVRIWSDAHFKVLEEYVRSIAALGQKSITVCAGEIPWGGQGCASNCEYPGNLFEYSIIGIVKKVDGSFAYDYSKMQRYIDLCTEAGMRGDIEIFGLVNVWQRLIETPLCSDYPENIVLRYLDEADGCIKYLRRREEIIAYIQALEAYFKQTGQIERVRIGADEPSDVERYSTTLTLLKEIAPAFRCSTAILHSNFIEEFQDRIDTVEPSLSCFNREYKRLMEHKAQFPHKKLLWYVCGFGSIPNNAIINPLIDNRCIGPLTDLFGTDGFLRWNYCLYPKDPRKDIRYSSFGAGDVNFVYPSHNGSVLLSLRYKLLRRGIVDYELLHALRLHNSDEANALLHRIFFFDAQSLDAFEDYRQQIGLCVDQSRERDLISRDWNDFNSMKIQLLQRLDEIG